MDLPGHILDRVERVYGYHRASKLHYTGKRLTTSGDPSEAIQKEYQERLSRGG